MRQSLPRLTVSLGYAPVVSVVSSGSTISVAQIEILTAKAVTARSRPEARPSSAIHVGDSPQRRGAERCGADSAEE